MIVIPSSSLADSDSFDEEVVRPAVMIVVGTGAAFSTLFVADAFALAGVWSNLVREAAIRSGYDWNWWMGWRCSTSLLAGVSFYLGGSKLATNIVALTGIGLLPMAALNAGLNGFFTYRFAQLVKAQFATDHLNQGDIIAGLKDLFQLDKLHKYADEFHRFFGDSDIPSNPDTVGSESDSIDSSHAYTPDQPSGIIPQNYQLPQNLPDLQQQLDTGLIHSANQDITSVISRGLGFGNANFQLQAFSSPFYEANALNSPGLNLGSPIDDHLFFSEPFLAHAENQFGLAASHGTIYHEVGHTVLGRVLENYPNGLHNMQWSNELWADYYAGYCLAREQLKIDRFCDFLHSITDNEPTIHDPGVEYRVQAAKSGYQHAILQMSVGVASSIYSVLYENWIETYRNAFRI
jgi:hypothetical protein